MSINGWIMIFGGVGLRILRSDDLNGSSDCLLFVVFFGKIVIDQVLVSVLCSWLICLLILVWFLCVIKIVWLSVDS